MGKRFLHQRSGASSRAGSWTSLTTTKNIWKIILVLSVFAFLNVFFTTQTLSSVDEGQRHLGLHSFAVTNVTRTSSASLNKDKDNTRTSKILKTAERHSEQENDGVIDGNNGVEIKIKNENNGNKNHMVKTQQPDQNELLGSKKSVVATRDQAVLAAPETTNATTKADEADIQIEYTPRHKPTKKDKEIKQKRRIKEKIRNANRTLSPEEKLKFVYRETAMMPNVSNAIYYKDIPPEFLVEDPSRFVWDRADAMIPEWMKDYFRWHRWKRSTWNKDRKPSTTNNNNNNTNNNTAANNDEWWESERWLISQCLMSQDRKKCGGTADRLKPIPVLLRIAYENKRIYLIRWTRPHPLEEFLVPPMGGFDWRVPPDLAEILENPGKGKRLVTVKPIRQYSSGGMSLIRARYQTATPGKMYESLAFNETTAAASSSSIRQPNDENDKDQFGFNVVFSEMWKVFFTPSPPIQTILRSRLTDLGLVPNEYVASHLRALYAVDERPTEEIHKFTKNALACATEIFPGVPIFFASDSMIAIEHAQEFDGTEIIHNGTGGGSGGSGFRSTTLQVITTAGAAPAPAALPKPPGPGETDTNTSSAAVISHQPWHLDSFVGPVENFYDTFVDLYLLAMAGCVTYNKGGYGHWGMLIGGHPQCEMRQWPIGTYVRNETRSFCHFTVVNTTENDQTQESVTASFNKRHPSVFGKDDPKTGSLLFLPPMD
jgi:hypothetical protein